MGWVRFDDRAIDHPKFLSLSAAAFRLWFEGMTYCNKHLTDGLISSVALRGFRYGTTARVTELLGQRLWETHDLGYKVHDYLDWNDNRETVEKNRAKARQRSSDARSRERTPYVPSGVVEESSLETIQIRSESVRDRFEEFWVEYPRKVGKDAAWRVWQRLRPDAKLQADITAALAWQRTQENWLREGGRFIPNPATWLNQGRWQDEPTVSSLPHAGKQTTQLAAALANIARESV